MKSSQEIMNLAAAMARAQKLVPVIEFDASANATRTRSYRYATLGAHIAALKPILPELGISYIQIPISGDKEIGIDMRVMHTSGEWIEQSFMFPMDPEARNPAQEAGKIITYARRYALASVFGLYGEEDVDASNAPNESMAQGPVQHTQATQNAPKNAPGAPKQKLERPYKPHHLRERIKEYSANVDPATDGQLTLLASILSQQVGDDNLRHDVQEYLFGTRSLKDADRKEINAALTWLDLDDEYHPSDMAAKELSTIHSAYQVASGQKKMDDFIKEQEQQKV